MRHLIDTYIEADEPRKISPFDNMGLLDLIVKTGIANAIATQLGGLKGNKDAIAETIENNVRSKIIKEHLNDPAFYEKMSALLDEIIAARKAKAIEYEEYLKRIAELAKKVQAGQGRGHAGEAEHAGQAGALQQPRSRDEDAGAAGSTKTGASDRSRPDGWRGSPGHASRRHQGGAATASCRTSAEVERIFLIIKAQTRILMVIAARAWRHRGGRGAQGHQERPSERLSARRAGCASPRRARMSLDTIRVFAISKLGWIKQQQKKLREQERETPREYLDRESHYVWGKRYLLKVVEEDAAPTVELKHRHDGSAGSSRNERGNEAGHRFEDGIGEQLKAGGA